MYIFTCFHISVARYGGVCVRCVS